MASFHQALGELQRSPLLAQAGVSVTAAEDTAGSELMAVATAAVTAVATVEQHIQRHADGSGWHGRSLKVRAFGFVSLLLSQVMLMMCWQEWSVQAASWQVLQGCTCEACVCLTAAGSRMACSLAQASYFFFFFLILLLAPSPQCKCMCSVLNSQLRVLSDKRKCMQSLGG